MTTRSATWAAIAMALLHMVLALAYSSQTPYRTAGRIMMNRGAPAPDVGAPDERQHANYVASIMRGELPVFRPDAPDAGERYEDHQPPLYYALAAGFAKIVGVGDVAAPEGIRLRWLNALVGVATVLGVFYLVRWGYERDDFAVGAASIAALLPMHCALDGAISNDPLLFALCTWTLAICALALRRGWRWKLVIWAGALTGLALLTKTTALALLPVLLLAVLIKQAMKPSLPQVVAAAAVILLISGGWLLRNQSLYGDPFALGIFNKAFTGTAQASSFVEGFGAFSYWTDWVGWWTARSFFGVFGYMDIWLNSTGSPYTSESRPDPNALYRLLLAMFALLMMGWIATFGKRSPAETKPVQWTNLLFLAVVVLLFLRFNITYFQGQGRYLYPAIGPICVAAALGAGALLKERATIGLATLALVLLGTNLYALSILGSEFAKRIG